MSDNEVFTSGAVEGKVRWQVRSSDAVSLAMFDEGGLLSDVARTWSPLRCLRGPLDPPLGMGGPASGAVVIAAARR